MTRKKFAMLFPSETMNAVRPFIYRIKMNRKEIEKSSGTRVIFRVPDDLEDAFLALRKLGYGDTEITVECLRSTLPGIRRELVRARAEESRRQEAELAAIPSSPSDSKTVLEAIQKAHAARSARARGKRLAK